jgi:hypothetical protein
MKNNLLKAIVFLVLILPIVACKKEKSENHETYFRGKLGGADYNAPASFFYMEEAVGSEPGTGVITGNAKVNGVDVSMSLVYILPDLSPTVNYFYSVEGQTDESLVEGSSVLVVTSKKYVNDGAVSYYEDCNGVYHNSTGTIKIGQIEKVGNKEYITGSFNGTVYDKTGGCSYNQEQVSIEFRVLNRRNFGG